MSGSFEEISGNKYLALFPTNEATEKQKIMESCALKSET